jgi:hypothetical protein
VAKYLVSGQYSCIALRRFLSWYFKSPGKLAQLIVRGIGGVNAALILAVLIYVVVRAAGGSGLHLSGGSVSARVRDILWFSFLCGLVSFSTIEAVKRLTNLRGLVQRQHVREWLSERTQDARPEPDAAFYELLGAMGSPDYEDLRRLFNLPAGRLAAQIGLAGDIAYGRPENYRMLIRGLTRGIPTLPGTEQAPPYEPNTELAFEVGQRIRTGVDQLQISLTERWRRYVQGSALWVSGAYGIGLVHAANFPSKNEPRYVLAALVLGGAFAWVARDLAAVLERSRR